MAVSKTRAKLVDVARQLFAKNGVDDTTMNDIAVASKKGRRTLYTYFKSKEDIYMAVVESELEMLSGGYGESGWTGYRSWYENTAADRNTSGLYQDGGVQERDFACRLFPWYMESGGDAEEFWPDGTKLFRQVLTEGKEKGIFDIDNVNIVADIVHYCVKGIEAPYIRGQIGEELDDETGWAYVAKIVYGALGRKEQIKE